MATSSIDPTPRVRPTKLIYAVDEWPPPLQLALLGAQYAVMSAIYLVLVAIVLRSAKVAEADTVGLMGIACIALAVGTFLQALPRGPVGSGFLAPPVYSATYLAPSVLAAQVGGMPLVFGMTIIAGLVEIAIALCLTRLRIVITPVISGLAVFIVGLQLGIVGIGQLLDVPHAHQPGFPFHLVVAAVTLVVSIALSIWGRGSLKLICSLCGLIVGMVGAILVGLIAPGDLATFQRAAWFELPRPVIGFEFDFALLPAFLAAGIAAAVRAVGIVTTCQRLNDAAWERPDMANIRKGVLADGLANVFGGAVGAQGMTVAPSLVGISSATGATSRAIAYAAAAILLVIGFMPKVAVFFLLVPPEVAGPLLVFTSCFMLTGGMELMLSRAGGTRAIYVIGISSLLALSVNVYPHYFHKDAPPVLQSFISNPLAFGLATAIILTLLFRIGTRQHAAMTWDAAGSGADSALAFLRSTAQGWAIPPRIVEAAAVEVRGVIDRLAAAHHLELGGDLRLST
ncbi:MAG TPA: solute carrier family 23 protein, partial [Reyranella sp.]|nr:solute carrier family 23 protein [Reyranella sp.]